MNWSQFKKNIGSRFQLEPIACCLNSNGHELPEENDDWLFESITDDEVVHLRNMRNNLEALLGKDHIYDFRTNPSRSDDHNKHGFLVLKVHIFMQGDKLWLRPNSRPGERVPIDLTERLKPSWSKFIRVDATAGVPVTASVAKIQYRLWSDKSNIPLMIRMASDHEGKFSQEVSGPSGVVDLLLTEKQAFYVSLASPNLHYELAVIGWEYN